MSKSKTTESESPTADHLKALLHEAEQALSQTAGEAGDKFDELRDRLRTALDQGQYSLDHLRAETTRRARQADELVRAHPYYAVGLAAGIGAVIGLLLARGTGSSR